MTCSYSVIKGSNNETFILVAVQRQVFTSLALKNGLIRFFRSFMKQTPVILRSFDGQGQALYFGRRDLIDQIKNLHPSQMQWHYVTI